MSISTDIMGLRKKRCSSCNNITDFFYLGIQEGVARISDIALYKCSKCKTTVSVKSLRKVNPSI